MSSFSRKNVYGGEYRDIKRRVKAAGRHAPVPILPGLVPYVAATVAEAQAKQQELDSLLPVAASLRQLGLFTAQDCMSWELDAPVPPLPSLEAFTGPKGRYSTILRIIATEHPTVRQLLGRLAAGGGHWTLVGTPEQIADEMEHWFVQEGADGFNLMPPMLPDGALRTIPFASLHNGKKFLIEEFAVAVAPGLSLIEPRPLQRANRRRRQRVLRLKTTNRSGFLPPFWKPKPPSSATCRDC